MVLGSEWAQEARDHTCGAPGPPGLYPECWMSGIKPETLHLEGLCCITGPPFLDAL